MSEQSPEFRFDPIREIWISLAPQRTQRPHDNEGPQQSRPKLCPFCRGSEHITPPSLLTISRNAGDVQEWAVRVIPNAFPAAVPAQRSATESPLSNDGVQPLRHAAVGYHEVIVESPDHFAHMGNVDGPQFERIVRAYRDRLMVLGQDERIAHVSLWKNSGVGAGASLNHIHSQLLAAPFVSTEVRRKIDTANRSRERGQECPWCELLNRELAARSRIVHESSNFVTLCPFASRFAAEMWILPKAHITHFERIDDDTIRELAEIWHRSLSQLETQFDQPAYNSALYTSPFRSSSSNETLHWHIEIMPRINGIAGFEIGSGNWINTIAPEVAAQRLRF